MTQQSGSDVTAQAAAQRQVVRARDHPAREVVVYSDRAEVCRPVRGLSLKAGRNEVEVVGLSAQLCSDTVRVETTSRVVILDVSHRRAKRHEEEEEEEKDGAATKDKSEASKRAEIRRLEEKKEDLESEMERLTLDHRLLESFASAFVGSSGDDAAAKNPKAKSWQHPKIDDFRDFMKLYGEKGRELTERGLELRRELRNVERDLERARDKVTAAAADTGREPERYIVMVVLETEEDVDNVEFRLSYVVYGASWTPRYDVRVRSNREQLELHYMAEVSQDTGEAWENVRMKLSTAMPSLQSSVPERVRPWRIGLQAAYKNFTQPSLFGQPASRPVGFGSAQQQQQLQLQQQLLRQQQAQQQQAQAQARSGVPPPPPPPPPHPIAAAVPAGRAVSAFGQSSGISEVATTTSLFGSAAAPSQSSDFRGGFGFGGAPQNNDDSSAADEEEEEEEDYDDSNETDSVLAPAHAAALHTGMMAAFEVKADATVPSDKAPHRVTISVLDIKAKFVHVAFPKIAGAHVYLRAFAKNDTELPLFPGACNIYVDGSYVTKSRIERVACGERFTCPLGADPAVSIVYPARRKRMSTSGFLDKVRTQKIEQSIKLHNGRGRPIFVQVFDQLPVCDEERLRVQLTTPAGSNVTYTTKRTTHQAGDVHLCQEVAPLPSLPDSELAAIADDSVKAGDCTGTKRVRRHPNGLLEWTLRVPTADSESLCFAYEVSYSVHDHVHGL
ncbi:hypothetical protein THASP1DRAFT_27514 [Thamnocephalis sphaerospora]|uniref:DUF4139 domain-containing protein n=1 Tax=Thamnocephalis sphaerospora TaxID=78915 RepID=A0A4P9XWK3_9FUNG|nr:hypothetical protein THASP1DRAFT_27514 [Thamnocephalis sphaerospora]|eukprot:RKP10714.1 hypothetical protein THASP1DRAFT_27514 [Thamnocephalis sphaerospora]